MKWFLILTLLVLPVILLVISEQVEATTICNATNDWCQGYGHVSTATGGVASQRCFAIRITNIAPICSAGGITPINEAGWEIVAGACINFWYFDVTNGITPPAAPNKVVITIRHDNIGATVLILADGTGTVASGTQYTFCATSTGITGASPRAGTYSMFMQLVKDNGAGGVGNYNIRNDGVAPVGAIISFDKGALRSQMLVSSITRNSYPSGSTFAYGVTGDELVTITSTFTPPNGDVNVETVRTFIADESTLLIGQAGATVDIDGTSGTLAQNYVVDNTFPFANNPWIHGFSIRGNSQLTGLKWTAIASTGHGANIVFDSDTTVHDSVNFNIDSRIVVDSDGVGTFATADEMWINKLNSAIGTVVAKYNRAESAYTEGYIFNARSEKLTKAMNIAHEDIGAITCSGPTLLTPTGAGLYSTTYTIPTGGSCIVANTDTGSERYIRVTNTDQNYVSLVDHYVSSLYYVDTHIQISAVLNKDDFPTENANEDGTYIISVAQTDTVHLWCHVKTVRKDVEIDTSGNAISYSLVDPVSTTRLSGLEDTESDGWTLPSHDLLASTPLGTWTANCNVTFNGNIGGYAQTFAITVEGGGGNNAMPGDPIKVSCTPTLAFTGQEVRCLIAETLLDGTGRIGNAAGTNIDIRAPDETLIISDANPVEWQHGIYIYDFTPANGEGYYSIAVETIDVDTMDPIPGIYALYVQSGLPISGNVTLNNTEVLNAIEEHRGRSFEFQMDNFLLLAAIAFFVIMAESKRDALYWFVATILSIYLLINRTDDSVIPLPIYVGWIFITLYQSISLLMNARAPRVDGDV